MEQSTATPDPPSASYGALYCALAVVVLQPIVQLTTGLYLIVLVSTFYGLPCDRPLDVWLLCYLLGLVGSTVCAALFWKANQRVDVAAEEGQGANIFWLNTLWWVAVLLLLTFLLFTGVWFIVGAVWAFESSPNPTQCNPELRLNFQYFFYYLFGATGFQIISSPVLSWINTLNPESVVDTDTMTKDGDPQARV